jgi:hypothetical protein
MNKPHRHAKLIKAWADGAEIETWSKKNLVWEEITSPFWLETEEYRIKPQPVITKAYMHYGNIEELVKQGDFNGGTPYQSLFDNNRNMAKHLELTFTDNKLTKVELKDATK